MWRNLKFSKIFLWRYFKFLHMAVFCKIFLSQFLCFCVELNCSCGVEITNMWYDLLSKGKTNFFLAEGRQPYSAPMCITKGAAKGRRFQILSNFCKPHNSDVAVVAIVFIRPILAIVSVGQCNLTYFFISCFKLVSVDLIRNMTYINEVIIFGGILVRFPNQLAFGS